MVTRLKVSKSTSSRMTLSNARLIELMMSYDVTHVTQYFLCTTGCDIGVRHI